MKNLTHKQISAVDKMRKRLEVKLLEESLRHYGVQLTNGQILDIIRYAKRLKLESKND